MTKYYMNIYNKASLVGCKFSNSRLYDTEKEAFDYHIKDRSYIRTIPIEIEDTIGVRIMNEKLKKTEE
jgi:hypothetical protein